VRGYEIWSLLLRQEKRLIVFELDRELRGIFECAVRRLYRDVVMSGVMMNLQQII